MTKLLKFISLCLVVLLFSCNSENDELQVDQKSDLLEIINLESREEQRAAFELLETKDKYGIWKLKYDLIVENDFNIFNDKKLNSQQIKLTKEVFNSLKFEYFENKESKNSRIYFDHYLPEMRDKVLDIFTQEEMTLIFSSLMLNNRQIQLPGIDCNCNRADDWCSGSTTCVMPCTEQSSWGCGWFGAERCDGSCGSFGF